MDLGGLVARNARTVPDKEGIIFQNNRYTWKQVNERVNTVSHALVDAGVKKGDKVAMWMYNSDLFMFAFYGIVKTGAVAVPVNFRLAAREAEYIFGNCDAVAVIFDDVFEPAVREMKPRRDKVAAYFSAGSERFDGFDPLSDVMASGNTEEPGIEVDEYDDSEIIYTSGTTGKPKGALLTHHAQMVLTTTVATLVALRPMDRILHAAPMFHSAELNLYCNPGTYVGATHDIVKDFIPILVLELIEKEKITQFFGAPVMYSFMMSVPDFDKYDLSSVRYYGYGAAPMAAEAVRRMIEKFKTDQFFCLCGLTEGGPGGVALYPEDQIRKAGAGGKYIVNMETRLVDPEATAETIKDGWVHTGDLGTMDDEGYITLVDRAKDMIITGGGNVYSKEVEDAIFENPAIADAVIIGVPHVEWGETVMAVVVLQEGRSLSLEDLREFLKPRIADYKIPRLLEVVKALPRNVSGKVLKFKMREEFKDKGVK